MRIRRKRLALWIACVTSSAYAQHGINVNDINRDGAVCNDFFDDGNITTS